MKRGTNPDHERSHGPDVSARMSLDEACVYVERWAAGRMDLKDAEIRSLAEQALAFDDNCPEDESIANFLDMLETLNAYDILTLAYRVGY